MTRGSPSVLLLFPPYYFPMAPYLSTPLLKAVLQQHGYVASQYDSNPDFFDYLLSPQYLSETATTLRTRLDAGVLSASQSVLLARAIANAELGLRSASDAMRVLRDPVLFYEPAHYARAIEILERSLSAISTRWGSVEFTTEGFRAAASPFSLRDCLQFARDPSASPFAEFYRQRAFPRLNLDRYEVVGISVAFPDQILPAFALAQAIREQHPAAFLVAGGNIFSRVGETIAERPEVYELFDAIVVGEGEVPLLTLLEAKQSGRCEVPIPGVLTLTTAVSYRRNATTIKATDLPTPDFDGLELARYFAPTPVLPLLTFKGCSYGKCTFCDHHVNYVNVSGRNAERVVADLEFLAARHGSTHFTFVDEEMPPAHAQRLAEAIQAKFGDTMKWMGYAIYRKNWTAEHWRLLYRAGCREMLFGFESATPRILDLMQKPLDLETVLRVTRDLNAAGIASRVNVIVGFPGETTSEARASFAFFADHQAEFDRYGTLIAFHPFLLVRNAPLLAGPLGGRIAIPNAEEPMRLHLDYDVRRATPVDGAPPDMLIDSDKAFSFAKELATELGTRFTQKLAPLWRVHRFLYIAYRRTVGDAPGSAPAPESCTTCTVVETRFDLPTVARAMHGVSSSIESYASWSNYRAKGVGFTPHAEAMDRQFSPDRSRVALVVHRQRPDGRILEIVTDLPDASGNVAVAMDSSPS